MLYNKTSFIRLPTYVDGLIVYVMEYFNSKNTTLRKYK